LKLEFGWILRIEIQENEEWKRRRNTKICRKCENFEKNPDKSIFNRQKQAILKNFNEIVMVSTTFEQISLKKL
jgi:hypothetical protein